MKKPKRFIPKNHRDKKALKKRKREAKLREIKNAEKKTKAEIEARKKRSRQEASRIAIREMRKARKKLPPINKEKKLSIKNLAKIEEACCEKAQEIPVSLETHTQILCCLSQITQSLIVKAKNIIEFFKACGVEKETPGMKDSCLQKHAHQLGMYGYLDLREFVLGMHKLGKLNDIPDHKEVIEILGEKIAEDLNITLCEFCEVHFLAQKKLEQESLALQNT